MGVPNQTRTILYMEPAAVALEAAMAIAVARRLRPPMKVFAHEVRRELGRRSLSARAIYAWERGEARVPAEALLAAALELDHGRPAAGQGASPPPPRPPARRVMRLVKRGFRKA